MRLWLQLSAIVLTAAAHAENPAPAPAPAGPVVYELRNLKPDGMTQYASAGEVIRQYFVFRNEQGSHHVVYEEVSNAAPLRTVASLRQFSGAFESECSMDVECSAKAFCLEGCKHMYYEVANAPADTLSPERANCRILFFQCEKAASPPAAVAAPPR